MDRAFLAAAFVLAACVIPTVPIDSAETSSGSDDGGSTAAAVTTTSSGTASADTSAEESTDAPESGTETGTETGVDPETILFRMDFAADAWPLAGWEFVVDELFGVRWTREHLPGGGPRGQDAARLIELPGAGEGQHGWGWHGHVVPDLEQGETRFFRWRHRVAEASNCLAFPSNKLLVVAQGCADAPCRVIVQPKCDTAGMIQYNFQIDGGDAQVETGYVYSRGAWLDVQLEIQTSSAPGVADGSLKEWIDNDDYDAPTIENLDIVLHAGGPDSSYVIFGGYNNTEAIPADATNVQDYTDFEIATAFAPSWDE